MRPPCTRECLDLLVGAVCPDCGHNSLLHRGPADVAVCAHCKIDNLFLYARHLLGEQTMKGERNDR